MKYYPKTLFTFLCCAFAFSACKKMPNKFFPKGTAVTLAASTTTVSPSPSDSLSTVLTLNWTNPKYATDSSNQKFIIEMDSSGRNFSHEVTFIVNGALSDSLTAKQLNNALLGWGFKFNTPYPVDIRVTSSYANNNEQYQSNVITVQMTPYKIPPKIPVPDSLYIIGGATPNGWNQPVPVPAQKMTQLDSVTFGAIIYLSTGNGGYDLLPVNGSWDNKYNIADASVQGAGVSGSFQASTGSGSDIPAPATAGYYELIFNFQTGTYTVTPYTGMPLPTSIGLNKGLWIIGDATPGGWNNNSSNAPNGIGNQQFTQISNAEYQIIISLTAGKSYLMIPEDVNSWANKYGGSTDGTAAGGGTILYDNDVPGSNTPAPSVSGNYLVDVNFITGKYTVTPH